MLSLLLDVTGGTLSHVVPLHVSSLLFLVGGGRSPRYPPNKVIFWDDAQGKEVAELEFRERVRGLACRRGWLAVALRRRVVVFQVDESISRYAEWDTCDNPQGKYCRSEPLILLADPLSVGFHRPPCNCYKDTRYLASCSGSTDGSRTAYSSTALQTTTTFGPTIIFATNSASSHTYQTPSVHNRRSHHCTIYPLSTPFRPLSSHYLC